MKDKWKKDPEARTSEGHPVILAFTPVPIVPMYKPKLLKKSTSMRALKNYDNLSIDNNFGSEIDNMSFLPESESSDLKYTEPYALSNSSNASYANNKEFDYTNVGTLSSTVGSDIVSEKNEMGSTTKLIQEKIGMSCQAWCSHLVTCICTISMASNMGNLFRLPQTTFIRGGLPFLIAYIILSLLIGLPLLFLELGIGQLAEEGFIKSWRTVPFFQGIGYVKLFANCLLSIYYPLYMGLAVYYFIWMAKGPVPFAECASGVRITQDGYSPDTKDGQQCLRQTFLKSAFEDPYWFEIFCSILFVLWLIITLLSIRRTKTYIRSLCILLFPTLICYVMLMAVSILKENQKGHLYQFFQNIDWSILSSANIWYYAAIQVFFSTNVGFGSFVTNAGIIYNKVNPLWTALGYMFANIVLGTGTVIMTNALSGTTNFTKGDIAEVKLITLIYETSYRNEYLKENYLWTLSFFALIIFSGLISMATITYTLLKAITVQNGTRLKWWQTSIILSFAGLVLGALLLLKNDFDLVHLFDHYIVGNLIIISVIIEVLALTIFYSTASIQSDFEFMLGHILSKIWLILWWILPFLLTGIFAWGLTTLDLEGIFKEDPSWLYGIGWATVLMALVLIFVVGFVVVSRQDGYTFKDKMKSSLEPSNNWGPKDPIQRRNWMQWNSKAQNGVRDFTLKRKGTRDYTRSVMRAKKKANLSKEVANSESVYQQNDQNQNSMRISNGSTHNYSEPYYINPPIRIKIGDEKCSMKVTSLVDTMDPNIASYEMNRNLDSLPIVEYRKNLNPLARGSAYSNRDYDRDDQDIEGYGTFRKGPFVIKNDNVGHVCHRKYSQSMDATEL